jgi:hypothetical protein
MVGMIDIETRVGPLSLRVCGLTVNFVANALALYGVAGVLRDGSRWPLLVIGLVITVGCLLVLAIPTPDLGGKELESERTQ